MLQSEPVVENHVQNSDSELLIYLLLLKNYKLQIPQLFLF